ncbi:hypothetical protein CDD83_1333 [Cordyceps sp. RAO-2017]|nr:hypothetical protein CDD83_1333 [Cordyceps sp. RAO-2017]
MQKQAGVFVFGPDGRCRRTARTDRAGQRQASRGRRQAAGCFGPAGFWSRGRSMKGLQALPVSRCPSPSTKPASMDKAAAEKGHASPDPNGEAQARGCGQSDEAPASGRDRGYRGGPRNKATVEGINNGDAGIDSELDRKR